MTEEQPGVNSRQYWDRRFAADWETAGGPEQTSFFAQLAMRMMPRWLLAEVSRSATLVDVGCAEGEAAVLLKRSFPSLQVTGMDFSEQAISIAQARHRDVTFVVGDIAEVDDQFDVVFCSNVLEHFHDPLSMLAKLASASKRFLIVLVPGWEMDRHHEHHVTFTTGSFPASIGRMRCLHVGALNCARIDSDQWPGYQLMVVYGDVSALTRNDGTIGDAILEAQLPGLSLSDLAELRAVDPALERLGQLAFDSMHGAATGTVVAKRLDQLEKRQEEIGYNTRLEISELIAHQASELQAVLSRRDESRQLEQAAALSVSENLRLELERKLLDAEARMAEQEARMAEQAVSLSGSENELDAWKRYAHALDENRRGLFNRLAQTMDLLRETHASRSWKLAAPLRWVSTRLLGRGAVNEAQHLETLQPLALDAPSASNTRMAEGADPVVPDMDWSTFARTVLNQRDSYRGVFIQEIVIDWNVPLYQRPQHMATAMARLGYLVIYKTINWTGDDVNGFRKVAGNVWLTNRTEIDGLRGVVRSVYSTAYADTPENLQKRSRDSVMVYEYIDHIDPQISGDSENIQRLTSLRDWAFSGGADLVVASARVLHAEAEAAVGPDKMAMVPNGVDTRHYRDPAQDRAAVDPRLARFREAGKPIVGYFGAIAPWLWYEEIEQLVKMRPDLGFVFIGPDYYGGVESLPTADNVIYLGQIDYRVLPAHAKLFDVCFIPFRPGEIARTTSPLKLFEYFALEKPVVVTSEMVECVAYPEVFRGSTARDLSEAIDNALAAAGSPQFRARLEALADENDWDKRAQTFAVAAEKVFAARSGCSAVTQAVD